MKKVVLSAALAIVSGAAFAQMTAVEDEVLSAQTGQDGISIALNVKAHIDAFEWIDTDTAAGQGGSVRFENIAIGAGSTLINTVAGTYMGLNGNGGADIIGLAARDDYATGIQFGGPINIDVEDVAAFSAGAAAQIGSGTGTDITGAGGYKVHVPAAGTKAVVIGLPRMVMSFNVGAIRVAGGGDTYSMGGIRVTNFDFQSTKVSIWGHKSF